MCTSEFRSHTYVTVSSKCVRWDGVGETRQSSNQPIANDKSRLYRQYRTGVERERESFRFCCQGGASDDPRVATCPRLSG